MENKITEEDINEKDLIEKYSSIFGSPFMAGIFLGINAIKDSAVYVDGPDCNFFRADMIYKTHDLFSTLKDPSINTRLYFSGVMPNKMVTGYDDKIHKKMKFIENNDFFKLGVVTCMPVTSLLGIQYDNAFRDFEKKDYIFVKSFTDKFRIDGYGLFLRELAKKIEFGEETEKKKNHISIVGFMFDRNEGDCIGNISEVKRIMGLIGVSIDSIWLNGGNYTELKTIKDSSLIVSLPYGELASKVLSRKLGVNYISTGVPFGLNQTINFIKLIAKELDLDENEVNKVIENELNIIKSKTDYLDEKVFVNKSFFYSGDQYLEDGIIDISNYYGLVHKTSYFYNGSKESTSIDKEIDFYIGNSEANLDLPNVKKIEFGFPSYNKHYISERPFMGFNGFLNISEDIYNTLSDF